MITEDNKIYMCTDTVYYITCCWQWLQIVVHISDQITGKEKKSRKFSTSLPPAHLLAVYRCYNWEVMHMPRVMLSRQFV